MRKNCDYIIKIANDDRSLYDERVGSRGVCFYCFDHLYVPPLILLANLE